jgi:hypothetical protein
MSCATILQYVMDARSDVLNEVEISIFDTILALELFAAVIR